MESSVRASGVRVATHDPVVTDDDVRLARRLAAADRTSTPPRRGTTSTIGAGRRRTEEEAIVAALAGDALQLVDAIPFASTASEATPSATGSRRSGARSGGTAAAPELTLEVPLGRDQAAVVLLEIDGVYAWQFGEVEDAAAASRPDSARRRRGAENAAEARRHARFEIRLPQREESGPAAPAPRPRRGALRKLLPGRAVALVFRFLTKPAMLGTARFLEREVSEGLVHVDSIDPATWKPLRRRPKARAKDAPPARVLLWVHGTFSSTVGSFGALAGLPEGRAWLRAALSEYDLILGWEHRSLSVLPSRNAEDLRAALQDLQLARPPRIDAIAFSRGGLVLRSLIENTEAGQEPAFTLGRAVFVGCTLAGTELARPANWHRLCDRYTNLAAAGVRIASMLPGAADPALLLLGAMRGLGGLVKTLATSAVHDGAIPGLAAMDPAGDFVTSLNRGGRLSPVSRYCAISSNFDRKAKPVEASVESLPPGLLLRLADRGSDALLGEDSDLVVHVASMTRTGVGPGRQILERHEFGSNREVHHCAYFSQAHTVAALQRWLEVTPAGAPGRRGRHQPEVSSAAKTPKRRGPRA